MLFDRSKLVLFLMILFLLGCVGKEEKEIAYVEKLIFSKAQLIDTARYFGIDSSHLFFSDSSLTIRSRDIPKVYVLDENLDAFSLEICNAHFPDFNSKVLLEMQDRRISKRQTQEVREMFDHLTFNNGERARLDTLNKKTILLSFGWYSEISDKKMGHYIERLGEYDKNKFELYLFTNCNYSELNMSAKRYAEVCYTYIEEHY